MILIGFLTLLTPLLLRRRGASVRCPSQPPLFLRRRRRRWLPLRSRKRPPPLRSWTVSGTLQSVSVLIIDTPQKRAQLSPPKRSFKLAGGAEFIPKKEAFRSLIRYNTSKYKETRNKVYQRRIDAAGFAHNDAPTGVASKTTESVMKATQERLVECVEAIMYTSHHE